MSDFTQDSLFGGQVRIRQSRSGYRFSMDAVVIAKEATITPGDRILDLGAGCGVISLILAHRYPGTTLYAVEIQKQQADMVRQNARDNNLEHRITVLHQDLKTISPVQTAGTVDVVICNPPHIKKSCGRVNPSDPLAISRHEVTVTLADLLAISEKMLSRSGRLIIIYPAERMVDLIESMRVSGIEPKKLRILYTKPEINARRILVEGVKAGRPGIKIVNPLIIHNKDGSYTESARRLFEQ